MKLIGTGFLASKEQDRRLAFTASSASAFGLTPPDILQHGLVQTQQFAPAQRPRPVLTLEERLFQALANAKIWTSQVAMRIDGSTRDRYFKQLDRLHDIEEWFESDEPIVLESYKGFIRLMLIVGGDSKPALALSPSGHLVAVWEGNGQRLKVEFKDADWVQWLVNCGRGIRTGGTVTIHEILHHLAPYSPKAWFGVD